jgi:ABC-type nitrate/sulfonate/bicarbonate transport system permease component
MTQAALFMRNGRTRNAVASAATVPGTGGAAGARVPAAARPQASAWRRFWRRPWSIRGTSILVFLVAWEIYGRHTSPIFLSYPTAIARAGWQMTASGVLGRALGQSMGGFVIGWGVSVIGGVVLGILIGRYRVVYYAADPFVTALYNTTAVALIPLIQLWFGFGLTAKVVIVIMSALFPVLYNTSAGVTNVSKAMVDVVRAYGATDHQITLKVVVPSAVPFIMTGIRLSVGRGIVGIVVAEFFTAITGLGGLIVQYSNNFETAKLFVPVLVLVGLGITLTELAKWAEKKIAPWNVTASDGMT